MSGISEDETPQLDLTDPEFALLWPREVFLTEAIDMMKSEASRRSFRADYEFLLSEAFAGSAPAREYAAAASALSWGTSRVFGTVPVVGELVHRADELTSQTARRPYFSHRRSPSPGSTSTSVSPNWEVAKGRFNSLVARWQSGGYFGQELPDGCVDVDDDLTEELTERLAGMYGGPPPHLTHNSSAEWSDDDFLDLVELLHDVAARPRNRHYHDYSQCGYHYSNHSLRTGQMLYRIRVNEIFVLANLPYRLATDGEDVGRLVTMTDDARAELLLKAAEQPTNSLADQVGHAISLYRSRASTREDKISAIRELMAVLEPDRYTVMKGTAAEKDNESLFQIANKYAMRHNKTSELRDYSTAFLDWMFWAALAMVQLCKELKAETSRR
ncbi:hypothetical protein J2W54_004990 [Rhodococcus fascians]|uniref:hypothetical protein n=1 Tax=Nocardiaceae TaxID=85025 RepID=UPI0028561410|nr:MULTISPECIES: hypothetical protein [Rhodococcus]MDR6912977.1 hypothetical protein [Rhodococcus sp. 3258]MDR6934574.1 hypothetical protein [Rhodococcus fascians]